MLGVLGRSGITLLVDVISASAAVASSSVHALTSGVSVGDVILLCASEGVEPDTAIFAVVMFGLDVAVNVPVTGDSLVLDNVAVVALNRGVDSVSNLTLDSALDDAIVLGVLGSLGLPVVKVLV